MAALLAFRKDSQMIWNLVCRVSDEQIEYLLDLTSPWQFHVAVLGVLSIGVFAVFFYCEWDLRRQRKALGL